MKKIVVEFILPDEEMDHLIEMAENGKMNPDDGIEITPKRAFRDQLQDALYDEFGMSGYFNVESFEDTDQTEAEWLREKWG